MSEETNPPGASPSDDNPFPFSSGAAAALHHSSLRITEPLPDGQPRLSWKEMADAKLPLSKRDACAHLLVPLRNCRIQNCYIPWRCSDERHLYEECLYNEYPNLIPALSADRTSMPPTTNKTPKPNPDLGTESKPQDWAILGRNR